MQQKERASDAFDRRILRASAAGCSQPSICETDLFPSLTHAFSRCSDRVITRCNRQFIIPAVHLFASNQVCLKHSAISAEEYSSA